jgi:hypothetical protein
VRFFRTGMILTLAALPALPQDKLPSAAEVFDKYVAAIGGQPALEKVTSRVAKGTIDVVTFGASGGFEQYTKAPDKLYNVSSIPGYGDVIQAYDGKAGWASMPDSGLRDMEGAELKAYARMSEFYRDIHLKDDPKAAVTGKAKVGERDAYVVETGAGGVRDKMYFDVQNGLLLRQEGAMPDNSGTSMTTFEDYKDVEGTKMPFTIKSDNPQMQIVIKFTDCKVNVPIEDAKFTKPAK